MVANHESEEQLQQLQQTIRRWSLERLAPARRSRGARPISKELIDEAEALGLSALTLSEAVEGFELSLAEPGDETPFQDRSDEQRAAGASPNDHASDASEDDLDPARLARHLAGGSALDLIA